MNAFRLRWWETVLLVPFVLLCVLFVLAGHLVALVVLAATLAVAVTSRARILEQNRAGGYARTRGWLDYIRACALFAIYGTIVYFLFLARREHWSNDTRGTVAVWAMAGLAFYLVRDVLRSGEGASRWFLGSDMEREAPLCSNHCAPKVGSSRMTSRRTTVETWITSSTVRTAHMSSKRSAAALVQPTGTKPSGMPFGRNRSSVSDG